MDTLQLQLALDHPELMSPTVTYLLQNWAGDVPVQDIWVTEINPDFAGSKDFCKQYGVSVSEGANCVIVEAVRHTKRTLAACVALVNHKIDFNGKVRKTLGARRVSLAPLEEVLAETQMEYGSVTPVGLPPAWPILIDAKIANIPRIIIGAGKVKAKLSLPGKALAELPGVTLVEGLSIEL